MPDISKMYADIFHKAAVPMTQIHHDSLVENEKLDILLTGQFPEDK